MTERSRRIHVKRPGEKRAEETPAPPPPPAASVPEDNGLSDALDALRRERADFINYRRRVQEERLGDREDERMHVLQRLLPVLDELDRALSQIPPEIEQHPWVQGVTLIRRRLHETLTALDVRPFGEQGDVFDPALHEAMTYERGQQYTEPTVSEVTKTGYAMGGRVLRPAQVGVHGPAAQEQSDQGRPE